MTRRHFDVVADGLEADIKIIAEGHDALRQDLTGLNAGQQRVKAGFGPVDWRSSIGRVEWKRGLAAISNRC